MSLATIGQIAAILFLIVTPFVWRKSMGQAGKRGLGGCKHSSFGCDFSLSIAGFTS